jgi:hypothetical protein
MRVTLKDDMKAGITLKGNFTYAEMSALAKEILSQMSETKARFIKENEKDGKFYLGFFVNRVDALLWGQGGGFLATLSRNKEANLVAVGEYEQETKVQGKLIIKVYSGIVGKRSTLSPKRLEAIGRFYEFVNLFHERLEAAGKDIECKIGLSEAAGNISYRRKAAILGGRYRGSSGPHAGSRILVEN